MTGIDLNLFKEFPVMMKKNQVIKVLKIEQFRKFMDQLRI